MYDIHTQKIWFNTYIKHFNIHPNQLFTIAHKSNFLPLVIQTKTSNAFIKKITLTQLAHGVSDFFILGSNSQNGDETAAYYADKLFQQKKNWDHLVLTEIPANDFLINLFIEQLIKKGFNVTCHDIRSFYHINLTANWDNYYKEYVYKKTLDLRTRINKMRREGFDYSISIIKTGITPYLNSIFTFYEERRKRTGQLNAFSNPLHANMLREIIPEYEKMGWMKLSILKGSDGKDWAYQLDFEKDGIQYHYAPTFDMKYSAYSPSKILLLESIKNAFADTSLHEFNFMRGESDYKKQFAFDKTPFINILINNPYSTRNKIHNIYNRISHIKLLFQKLNR